MFSSDVWIMSLCHTYLHMCMYLLLKRLLTPALQWSTVLLSLIINFYLYEIIWTKEDTPRRFIGTGLKAITVFFPEAKISECVPKSLFSQTFWPQIYLNKMLAEAEFNYPMTDYRDIHNYKVKGYTDSFQHNC